ncbi:MAG: HAD family hydrolase [Opitutaceae bacterium]|nr:HAD family hydrolase [Opitutaceae bacterium]
MVRLHDAVAGRRYFALTVPLLMNTTAFPIRLFAADIEDTVLGDTDAVRRFRTAWESLPAGERPLLVYNTGRSVHETQWLILERQLPAPEFIIGGVGTELFDPLDHHVAEEFASHLAPGWDIGKIEHIIEENPGVRRQAVEFHNPYKSSWHWPLASSLQVVQLRRRLEDGGLDVNVLYSAKIYLDVIPRRAGKGAALAWLAGRIGIALENTLVAGAAGNNVSMFALPGVRGIVVGNAAAELLTGTTASKPFVTRVSSVDGVLAGLLHFGVLSPETADAEAKAG